MKVISEMSEEECIEALKESRCTLVRGEGYIRWERWGEWIGTHHFGGRSWIGTNHFDSRSWCRDELEFHREILVAVIRHDGPWEGSWEPPDTMLTDLREWDE